MYDRIRHPSLSALAQDAVDFCPSDGDPRDTMAFMIERIQTLNLGRMGERLTRLLVEAREYILRCEAPASSSPRATDVCGRFFVPHRPNQRYCGWTCQARMNTYKQRVARSS
jgi:hypothetical protein